MCKVLIADDSDIMRDAIRSRLEDDSSLEIVGEARCFADAIQRMADPNGSSKKRKPPKPPAAPPNSRPDVVIVDLSMPAKERFTPELVKAQLSGVTTVAISFTADEDAHKMARLYGAKVLLDKMMLYIDLIPAVSQRAEALQKPSFENVQGFCLPGNFLDSD
jgi:DNA-binding NarL/FixJ family response regulator